MKSKSDFSRMAFVAGVMILAVSDCPLMGQSPTIPPPNFKVAFIGGQGKGENARAVLHLIKSEGAQAVIHQGDLDYDHNPPNWDKMISDSLGVNFPYFVSAGDADVNPWEGSNGYQAMVENRLRRLGIIWNGDLGVNSSLYYNGLFIVLSGVDIFGTNHSTYIRDQLAADNSIWRICSWHKNMRLMQVAGKKDETGWGVYEESRLGGAIIATGHSHTYSRTHLLSSIQNQTIASTSNELHIEKGKTFVFVHEIGGQGISSQELSGNWWASIYTRTQGAKYGALFGVFHVDGQPNKARFYMKNIAGQTIDTFTVISHVNENVSPTVAVTMPNGGETWEIGATHQLTWNYSYFSSPVALDYSLDGGTSWIAIASGVANNGSYAWNVATAPSTQARVRIADAADGDPSDASDNNFILTNLPLAPANLVAAATGTNSITLSWSDNSGIEAGFVIERKTGAEENYSQIATNGPNVTSYADNDLAVNTTYFYRVRATNGTGDSGYSNEANATTQALPQPPAAPGNLSATAASSSQINLSWADNSNNETSFEIDRAAASGGPYTQIAVTGANVRSYADNGLAVSTTYFYRVRATNAAGDSPNSTEVSATTLGAPTGNLALNKPATASSTNSSYVPSRAVDGSTASSSYWRSANVSKTSPNTWLRVDLGAAFSLTRAVVQWKENYFAKQYRLQISNSGGSADGEWTTVYTNTAGAAGTQDVTFTSPFAARYFRIRMDRNNKDNNRILELACYAGAAKLNTGADGFGSAASPGDFELEQNYPNPFWSGGNPTTMIRFQVPAESEVALQIFSVNGQLVKELATGMFAGGKHSLVWDATDNAGQRVASGVYVYVLKAGGFTAQRKLVVMK